MESAMFWSNCVLSNVLATYRWCKEDIIFYEVLEDKLEEVLYTN